MSVWKKLNKQDSFVTTYVAKKRWSLSGSDLESAGVKLLPAYSSFSTKEIQPAITDCSALFSGTVIDDGCFINIFGTVLTPCAMELSGSIVI